MPKQMQYVCKQCEYSTTRKFNLERHEKKHKMYLNINNNNNNENNNNIPVNETKLIQEAIKINGAPNHLPLHNIQSGSGSVVTSSSHIPIEKSRKAGSTLRLQ